MSDAAKAGWSLRHEMPNTAKWIDQKRGEYGKPYVDDLVRRALARDGKPGEPGLFYAIENGHVLGTPFGQPEIDYWQRYAVVNGASFAAFIRPPTEQLP